MDAKTVDSLCVRDCLLIVNISLEDVVHCALNTGVNVIQILLLVGGFCEDHCMPKVHHCVFNCLEVLV